MSRHEYPMPPVQRVHTEHGSHIEPPLDPTWTDGQQLAWHAAIVQMDTGLTIRIRDGGMSVKRLGQWVPVPGLYSMTISGPGGSSGHSSASFKFCWTFLNGISTGARAGRATHL